MAEKTNILLVEDEPVTRKIIRNLLTNKGYKITEATDGKKALSLILAEENKGKFNLLLTDYSMPEMNGSELIDKIKENNITIPIIVFTSQSDKDLILEFMRKGCKDFIAKPISPTELPLTIKKVLDR